MVLNGIQRRERGDPGLAIASDSYRIEKKKQNPENRTTNRKKKPITSFDGPLLGIKMSRSRGKDEKKLRQEKAKMRKKDKTLKHVFFWDFFCNKTGEVLKFRPFFGPLIEVMAKKSRRTIGEKLEKNRGKWKVPIVLPICRPIFWSFFFVSIL